MSAVKSLSMLLAAILPLALAQAPANGSISGTVRGATGEPSAGVRVAAMPVAGGDVLVGIAETDRDGRYRLENVPPGRYYITAGLVSAPTYCPGTRDPRLGAVVTIAVGSAITGHDCTITFTGATVSGRVVSQTPNPRWTVVLEGPTQLQASAAADGTFKFLRLAPGKYTASIVGFRPANTTFTVEDHDIENLEIVMPTYVTLQGRIVMESGAQLPAVPLTVSTDGGGASPSSRTVRAEPTGEFAMQILTGNRTLTVAGLPSGYVLKTIRFGKVDLGVGPFKLVDPPDGAIVLVIAR